MAYPVLVKDGLNFERRELQIFLEKKGIQTRSIFTGNILRQPIMKNQNYKKTKKAEINSNIVMKNGMLLGCHHGMTIKQLDYMIFSMNNFLRFKKLI